MHAPKKSPHFWSEEETLVLLNIFKDFDISVMGVFCGSAGLHVNRKY